MLHVTFLTLLRALEVNIDLRHVNHIRYYYYYYYFLSLMHVLEKLFTGYVCNAIVPVISYWLRLQSYRASYLLAKVASPTKPVIDWLWLQCHRASYLLAVIAVP